MQEAMNIREWHADDTLFARLRALCPAIDWASLNKLEVNETCVVRWQRYRILTKDIDERMKKYYYTKAL